MTPILTSVLLRTQSDERLVALARAGHERAFDVIVDRHRSDVARALRRYLPAEHAEDVVQQTFISAWTALSGGAEVRALQPWLFQIARNGAVTALTRPGYGHDELVDGLSFAPGPEEELEHRIVMRRTLKGIAALPDRQRAALLAVAVDGRAHAEVALELGLSEPAVRQLVHRARASLRAAVGAFIPTPLIGWALQSGASDGVNGAALGAGGAGALATTLKVGALVVAVGAVGTPVVHHATRHSGGHAASPRVSADAASDTARRHRHSAGAAPSVAPRGGRPTVAADSVRSGRPLTRAPHFASVPYASSLSGTLSPGASPVPVAIPAPVPVKAVSAPTRAQAAREALLRWWLAHAGHPATARSRTPGRFGPVSTARPASGPGAAGSTARQQAYGRPGTRFSQPPRPTTGPYGPAAPVASTGPTGATGPTGSQEGSSATRG